VKRDFLYRYLIAFTFVLLVCIETFGNLFTVAGYYLDNEVYAENCVNKDKPQMHCDGKCQLQKKLTEEDNKDKQNTERKNETGIEVLSSKSFFATIQKPFPKVIATKYFIINTGAPVDHSFQFFHPPQSFFM